MMYSFRGSKAPDDAGEKKQSGSQLPPEPSKDGPAPVSANPFLDSTANPTEDRTAGTSADRQVDIFDMIGLNHPQKQRQTIPGSPNVVLMKKHPKKRMCEGCGPLEKLSTPAAAMERSQLPAGPINLSSSVPDSDAKRIKFVTVDEEKDALYHSPRPGVCCIDGTKKNSCGCEIL